jgi:nitrate/nitrite transporter NarK
MHILIQHVRSPIGTFSTFLVIFLTWKTQRQASLQTALFLACFVLNHINIGAGRGQRFIQIKRLEEKNEKVVSGI